MEKISQIVSNRYFSNPTKQRYSTKPYLPKRTNDKGKFSCFDKKIFEKAYNLGALSRNVKLVYFALCNFANKDGECFVSYDTIMDVTGIGSRNTISDAIQFLDKYQIVAIKQIPTPNGRFVNHYRLIDSLYWIIPGSDLAIEKGLNPREPP